MEEEKLKPLNRKQKVFVAEYVKCWNASEAARRAGYSEKTARSIGQRLLKDVAIKAEIDARLAEIQMGADEALSLQADIARSNIGDFFRVVEEWMMNPLPSYEILDEKEEIVPTEDGGEEKQVRYLVRHVVLDTEKLVDPKYSHLVHKFSDSKRSGLSIETYDKQAAIRDVLKVAGKIRDGVTIQKAYVNVSPDDWDKDEQQ